MSSRWVAVLVAMVLPMAGCGAVGTGGANGHDNTGGGGNGNDNSGGGGNIGNCGGASVTETDNAFFVDGSSGNDGNLGGKNDPLASIQEAIDQADALDGGAVYVAGGIYRETITLRSNVDLFGGFDEDSWVQCPSSSQTTIVGGPTAMTGNGVESLTVNGLGGVDIHGFASTAYRWRGCPPHPSC